MYLFNQQKNTNFTPWIYVYIYLTFSLPCMHREAQHGSEILSCLISTCITFVFLAYNSIRECCACIHSWMKEKKKFNPLPALRQHCSKNKINQRTVGCGSALIYGQKKAIPDRIHLHWVWVLQQGTIKILFMWLLYKYCTYKNAKANGGMRAWKLINFIAVGSCVCKRQCACVQLPAYNPFPAMPCFAFNAYFSRGIYNILLVITF